VILSAPILCCKDIRIKSTFYRTLNSTVTIFQYVLTAIFVLIVLQILLNSHYSTVLINLSSAMSYALAAFTMGYLHLSSFHGINQKGPLPLCYTVYQPQPSVLLC
jgi:hypothetical protein